MKIDIEVGQDFTHDGVRYTCVGHDKLMILGKMIWGSNNEIPEALPFDSHDCVPISEFTTHKEK